MIIKTPNCFFLVRGTSDGFQPLNAFDGALLDAGIGNTNLVKMSSIVPPHCQLIEPIQLPYGALVPVAYASLTSSLPGEHIAAAIAVAFPQDSSLPGVIMEYSGKETLEIIEQRVRKMAEQALIMRNEPIKEIKSIGIERTVEQIGAVFAGAVLWHTDAL